MTYIGGDDERIHDAETTVEFPNLEVLKSLTRDVTAAAPTPPPRAHVD